MIEMTEVHHRYGQVCVLKGINLRIAEAGISGLVAPNGEGKTTLLKLLIGLQFPTSGAIEVLGQNPAQRPLDLLQRIYFLPSEPFSPACSPQTIAQQYAHFYPNFNHKLYDENLQAFRIDPQAPLDRVSFGQKRRAQLSFALATRAQILLFDEPTIGLDIQGKDQFRRSLIAGTEAGQTILIATHLLAEISEVLNHLIILNRGTVLGNFPMHLAQKFYSTNLRPDKPPYGDKCYARRVPGGWLTVHADGRPSNTDLNLEALYLGITEGTLPLPQPVKPLNA